MGLCHYVLKRLGSRDIKHFLLLHFWFGTYFYLSGLSFILNTNICFSKAKKDSFFRKQASLFRKILYNGR